MKIRKRDVLWGALAVSLVMHVVTMIVMRPQIMTRIAAGFEKARTRGPMEMSDAEPPADSVQLEVVKDVAPLKESPSARIEDSVPVANAPIDVSTPLVEVAPAAKEDLLAVPLIDSEDALPKFYEQMHVTEASSPPVPNPSDVFAVARPDVTSSSPAISSFVPSIAMPSFSAPRIDAPEGGALDGVPPSPPEEKAPKEQFTPTADVLPSVDERVVESEKAAVRDLLDARDMQELSKYVKISATSAKEGNWVYFKVKFDPKAELPTVSKDVVILLDASGSIGNDRLQSCRAAARRILRSINNTGDRFNLVAFRDKFTYAFNTWQECNDVSFNRADIWLGRLAAHGRTDVFASIRSVLTLVRDPSRPLIAVVVTDGDANAGVRETSEILSKFTALNDGLISVYMYGVKESANRELLDLLTHGNRGESFIYSGDRHHAGGNLEGFSQRFRDPVLSDIRVLFAATSSAEMYPRRLKNLYRGDVLEFYGRVPAGTANVAFSVRGLNGTKAYEGFFRVSLSEATFDAGLPAAWRAEQAIDAKLK